jgi:hypothetical protein
VPPVSINEWRGEADDLPYFVMARTAPIVDRRRQKQPGGVGGETVS